MFTDRLLDGTERPPELFFRRAASRYRDRKTGELRQCDPATAGAGKDRRWNDRQIVKQLRTMWEKVANKFLYDHGHQPRIDLRPNAERGLGDPEPKIGPEKRRRQPDKFRQKRKTEALSIRSNRKAIKNMKTELSHLEKEQRHEHTRTQRQRHRERNRHTKRATVQDLCRIDDLQTLERCGVLLPGDERHHLAEHQAEPVADRVHKLQSAADINRRERARRDACAIHSNEYRGDDRPSRSPLAAMTTEIREDGRTLYRWIDGNAEGLPAMIDRGDYLTLVGKPSVPKARALIELAKAKGWETLVLTGSDEFKRMAAREALCHGLRIANPELASIVKEEDSQLMTEQPAFPSQDQDQNGLAREWLMTVAPVDAVKAARLKDDPERLNELFESDPEARRWELIHQQRAEGVPEPLLGFRIERNPEGVTEGTVRHVGKFAWIEPHDRPRVVVPLTSSLPLLPGQRIAVQPNGSITTIPDHENALRPR